MKVTRSLSIIAAIAVVVPSASFAAEKKAAKKEGAAPAAETKKSDAKPAAEAGKPIPMYARVDNIDASHKSFVTKRKDGFEIKHVLAASAEVKNNGADAKFEDIKIGDYVSGTRIKKGENEYEVVKITKFGPAAPKKAKEGDAAKKADEKKKKE
jgi:hypothetical protein